MAGGKGSGTPAGSGDRKLEEADPERGRWMLATCSVQSPATGSRGGQALAAALRTHPPYASDFILNGRFVLPQAGAYGAPLTRGRTGEGTDR